MKTIYLLLALVLCSCDQVAKDKVAEAPGAIEVPTDEVLAAADTHAFEETFLKLALKQLPLVDNTSLHSWADSDHKQGIDAETFQLPSIYKDWYKESYDYRAVSAYRLALSKAFYTAVVTILQGDEVLESRLINYDLSGKLIASQMVAHDEIEGLRSWFVSNIEKDKVIQTASFYVNGDEPPNIQTETIHILENGQFKIMSLDEQIISLVISQLQLDDSKIPINLRAFKRLPNNPNEAIVLIPEIAEASEDGIYFELNTHIAIVDLTTKEITHQYFESHQTNGWISDAIQIEGTTIDTANYRVNKEIRAFGVKLYASTRSKGNPYTYTKLSLFIKSNDTLKKILNNFLVYSHGGEWDTNCAGVFFEEEKTLMMSEQKTNGYHDIVVNNKFTKSIHVADDQHDCVINNVISHPISVLKFDGKTYD